MIIIVDIDDTIVRYGDNPIQKNIDYINNLEGRKVIITGRPDGSRVETVAMLKKIGFNYSRLMMNPYGSDKSGEWKKEAASSLSDVALAIDNDPKVRRIYNSLGIKTMDPRTIWHPLSVSGIIVMCGYDTETRNKYVKKDRWTESSRKPRPDQEEGRHRRWKIKSVPSVR